MAKKSKKKNVMRPWCYYCERDFEDEKVLLSHQKAKHYRCPHCPRRLNTAGGLAVHINQVHKLEPDKIENTLPGRDSFDVEIYGMEGIPTDIMADYKKRKEEELGLDVPQSQQHKRPRVDLRPLTEEELRVQLEQHKALMRGLPSTQPFGVPPPGFPGAPPFGAVPPAFPQPPFGAGIPPPFRPGGALPLPPPGALPPGPLPLPPPGSLPFPPPRPGMPPPPPVALPSIPPGPGLAPPGLPSTSNALNAAGATPVPTTPMETGLSPSAVQPPAATGGEASSNSQDNAQTNQGAPVSPAKDVSPSKMDATMANPSPSKTGPELVWKDETFSPEERRASLSHYVYAEGKEATSDEDMNGTGEKKGGRARAEDFL